MSAYRSICPYDRLPVDRGVAALVDGEQVAVFRTHDDELYAVSNLDPFSGAMVMSRGIVGSRGDRPTVASPVYKQVFDLARIEHGRAGKYPEIVAVGRTHQRPLILRIQCDDPVVSPDKRKKT